MPIEKPAPPPPRERTFAEIFPWRNMRRALMLVLLIVAIVMLKRSAGGFLAHVTEMWGAPTPQMAGTSDRPGGVVDPQARTIRLGPGLAPHGSTSSQASERR